MSTLQATANASRTLGSPRVQSGDLFLVQRGDVLHHMPASRLSTSRPWTPEDLPAEVLLSWLDASDLDTMTLGPNDGVAEWRDKATAGAGRVFTQGVLGDQPPLAEPWVGALGGFGGNLSQQGDALPLPFVTVRVNAALAEMDLMNQPVIITGGSLFETGLAHLLSNPNALLTTASGSNIPANFVHRFTPVPSPPGSAYVSSAGYGVALADWAFAVNGTPAALGTSTQTPAAAPQAVASVAIAQYIMLAGNASERTEEIAKLEGWAAHKYGFAADLAAGHPYREAAPMVEGLFDALPQSDDLFLVQRDDVQYQVSGAEVRAWMGIFEPWTPADMVTSLWLDFADASTVSLVDGLVSSVTDKSGNNSNFGQGLAAAQPSYGTRQLNGVNVLDLSAAGRELAGPWISPGSMIVLCLAEGGGNYAIFGEGDTTWSWHRGSWPSQLFMSAFATAVQSGAAALDGGAWRDPWVDYPQAPRLHVFHTTSPAAAVWSSLSWGRGGGSQAWQGFYAEVIATPERVTDTEKALLEGYLMHKWGLAAELPIDHPYKNAPPTK
jgi:hypothetical protein